MLRSLDGHCASLLGCSLSSCYWSSPELKTSCANPWLLITLSLGTLASGNWAAKSAGSPGRKFLVPLLLCNSIAREDLWGWLNCGLGGIFVLESLSWAKEYNIELEKQQNNLGKIHHICSHIYLLWEKGLVFYLSLQEFHMDFSLPTLIFAMAFLT